ncbi:glycosyltransferase [Pseudarthrobacter sp. CC12]|uniref:glycosyltransferase family 2 protein n=1 Tax=Pseudarthrobacter sp. CC12 TaxID=3029193 RepID=UPI0032669C70
MRLFVIMACHNRRELTVQSIQAAYEAALFAGVKIKFTVFDDGSTDGTSNALSKLDIPIRILHGDGSAFWARGMAIAEDDALDMCRGQPNEYIVWLNDDVVLDKDAFMSLSGTLQVFSNSVVVGAMRDPINGKTTYSGMRRAGLHPLRFDLVLPTREAQNVEVFNGNLVVVPVDEARVLGGIDGGFSHALADIDYGLRCNRRGIGIVLAPSTYGTCSRNPAYPSLGIRNDWAAFVGPKGGGNYASLRRILRKNHHVSWPMIIAVTYGLWWVRRFPNIFRPRSKKL